jgi:biopolymer transport protein ExbB
MSVSTWVVIVWKTWLLHRASRDVERCIAAFWQSGDVEDASQKIKTFDREALVLPMVEATKIEATKTLAGAGGLQTQLTRMLRNALHQALTKLQHGQVLLATVGATAPFVGLLGTVWGIYHALIGIATAGQVTIDKISGPVGESLIMTAAGLAVAIPAVLAYNVLGRSVARIEAELEGFARDLRELVGNTSTPI